MPHVSNGCKQRVGSKKSRKAKDANAGNEKKDFQWTDDEAELLLNVTYDYKVTKAVTSTDWESVKSKYEDILERLNCPLNHRQRPRENTLAVV